MVAYLTFSEPSGPVRRKQPNTSVYVDDNCLGKGTLYIAESFLAWGSDAGKGFTIEYPHIAIHAISRDVTTFPHECIYIMLDTDFNGEVDYEDNEDPDERMPTELRLVPDDRGMLDAMFHALNYCQTLHPDPEPEERFSDEDLYYGTDEDYCPNSSLDEADSQMAGLRIRNMDDMSHIEEDRVGEPPDMEEDRVVEALDMEEDSM